MIFKNKVLTHIPSENKYPRSKIDIAASFAAYILSFIKTLLVNLLFSKKFAM